MGVSISQSSRMQQPFLHIARIMDGLPSVVCCSVRLPIHTHLISYSGLRVCYTVIYVHVSGSNGLVLSLIVKALNFKDTLKINSSIEKLRSLDLIMSELNTRGFHSQYSEEKYSYIGSHDL